MRINLRKNNGITLIALIVTIIILIILAGISIGTLTGDNGIIKQAQTAKTETERSDIEEKINVIVIDNSKEREMDKDKLINDFENKLPDGKEIVDSDNLIYIIYPEYSFEVDIETGDVKQTEIERVEDETPWELAGSGTEEDPYLIESIEDLVAFSNSVNNGNEYRSKYIKLTTDLDFNLPFSYDNPKTKVSEKTNRIIEEDSNGTELKTFLTSGTGFNPIGNETTYFYGTFDGNGKEIKNIYINRPTENSVGLFSVGGVIEKLGVTGRTVGKEIVGGICSRNGEIKYCYSDIDVEGKLRVGGFSGYISNIENSYNKGEVNLNSEVSEGSACSAGGLVGDNQSSRTIKNSYNSGNITGVKNDYYIGGLVGFGENILNSLNFGQVTSQGEKYIVGGILGGDIKNEEESAIMNCYNYGNVTNGVKLGAIAGKIAYLDKVNNCYYLNGSSSGGINGQDIDGKAMPLEESEMPSVISVLMTDSEKVEWNGEMVDIWKEDTENINNGYPILFWQ